MVGYFVAADVTLVIYVVRRILRILQLNETFYDSTLTILQVDQHDYGDYKCIASNDLGRTTSVNRLTVFSHPDPPFNFRSVNSTHDRVTFAWSPGFDGGMPH